MYHINKICITNTKQCPCCITGYWYTFTCTHYITYIVCSLYIHSSIHIIDNILAVLLYVFHGLLVIGCATLAHCMYMCSVSAWLTVCG